MQSFMYRSRHIEFLTDIYKRSTSPYLSGYQPNSSFLYICSTYAIMYKHVEKSVILSFVISIALFFYLETVVDDDTALQASPVLLKSTKQSKAPLFTEELTDVTIYSNQPLVLKCKVTGLPRPDIRWFRYTLATTCSTTPLLPTCICFDAYSICIFIVK